MEPVALSVAVLLFILVLLRRPGVFAPAMAFAAGPRETTELPDEDEELPLTDRAPSRPWLRWTVASVAAVRIVLLVALHA